MKYFLIPLLVLIAAGVLALVFFTKRTRRKGARGEREISKLLGRTKRGKQYVVNDLLFLCGEGQSCQIDHILINRNGVFVIETKNYAGEIFGSDGEREWTQVLGRGNVRNKLYNPVMQNEAHIRRLSKALHAKDIFRNLVVFLPGADLRHVSSKCVFSAAELPDILRRDSNVRLTEAQMERLFRDLSRLRKNCGVTKRQHVRNIKRTQKKIEKGICPRCGKKLVLRQADDGSFFYGCSAFPQCKFKRPLS